MGRIDYREIYHYGIKKRSGRYPYGSGDRPYQSSGGLKGLFRRNKDSSKVLRKGTVSDPLIERQKHIANKANVLKGGRASEVLKYRGELTNRELQEVCQRFEYEKKLQAYAQSEVNDAMKKVDIMMKNLKTFNEWASIGTDTYNMMASVYNATSEGRKKPMTLVNKPQQSEKKDKNKGKGK